MTAEHINGLRIENLKSWIKKLSLTSHNWAIFTNGNKDIIPVDFDTLSSCEGIYELTRICDSNNYKNINI